MNIKGTVHYDVKSQQQECEATGHVVSAVRKQRGEYCPSTLFSIFICSRTPAPGMVVPTFRVGFPTSNSPIWKSLH